MYVSRFSFSFCALTTSIEYSWAEAVQELSIDASLSTIVLHSVRANLLHEEGLSLGLVGSAFTFTSVNFFWSAEYWSAISSASLFQRKSVRRLILILLLLLAGALAATVGPASALLFVPQLRWWKGGGTEFYLRGPEDQVWPLHLTKRNIGGSTCHNSSLVGKVYCVSGGFPQVLGHVMASNTYISHGPGFYDISISDQGWIDRTITLQNPYNPGVNSTETWAYTVHMASSWLAYNNHFAWNIAKQVANTNTAFRQLETAQFSVSSKIPVVRAACGPASNFTRSTEPLQLLFPVMSQHASWGDDSVQPAILGPLKSLDVSDMHLLQLRDTKGLQAKWFPLPPDFGDATAGLALVTRNNLSFAAGRGCVVDARWATGQTYLDVRGTTRGTWMHSLGTQSAPIQRVLPPHFLDLQELYSPIIKADEIWLDGSNPQVDNTIFAHSNMTNFEIILNATRLNDATFVSTDVDSSSLLGYVQLSCEDVSFISAPILGYLT